MGEKMQQTNDVYISHCLFAEKQLLESEFDWEEYAFRV